MQRRTLLFIIGSSLTPGIPELAFAQAPAPANLSETLETLDQVLSSDFARIGLDAMVRAIYSFRREMQPLRYETKDDWDKKFEETYLDFSNVLWKIPPRQVKAQLKDDKKAFASLEASYSKNWPQFQVFQSRILEAKNAPSFIKSAPPGSIIRSQFYFAAFLRANGEGPLAKAASISAIWPLCG